MASCSDWCGAPPTCSYIGLSRPGVAYMLPSLIETHATLWGAETAGYAVPINFLLQPEHIAALLRAAERGSSSRWGRTRAGHLAEGVGGPRARPGLQPVARQPAGLGPRARLPTGR